jgi:hypothetical protein
VREIYEFFFCPVHGIFGANNWPILAPVFAGGAAFLRGYWCRISGLLRRGKNGDGN